MANQSFHLRRRDLFLYNERNVKVNYSFAKGELKAADIEKIIGDVKKITK